MTVAGQKGLGCHSSHPSMAVQLRGGGVTGHMPHTLLSHCRQTRVMLRHRDIWGCYYPRCKKGLLRRVGGWGGNQRKLLTIFQNVEACTCDKTHHVGT